ncbi:MAG: hypothetical protein KGP12_12485 [Actinomycetales bacterium]|nr:hypothetical protein [Actinomycetales bacterium]
MRGTNRVERRMIAAVSTLLLTGSAVVGVAHAAPGDHAGGRGIVGQMVAAGSLTKEQARAIKSSIKGAGKQKAAAVAALVASGTLTAEQGASLTSAIEAKQAANKAAKQAARTAARGSGTGATAPAS